MGYNIFAKVKTITLPTVPAGVTIDEYKSQYGIDLRDLFEIVGKQIDLKNFGEGILFLVDDVSTLAGYHHIYPVTRSVSEDWSEGSNDGKFRFYFGNWLNDAEHYGGSYLEFSIPKDSACVIENLQIMAGEL